MHSALVSNNVTSNILCLANLRYPLFHMNEHSARVWGWRWGNANFSVGVGGNVNSRVFTYQHVGIPNSKLCCWGLSQREDRKPVVLRRSGI